MYNYVQIMDHMKVCVSYYYSFVEDLCQIFCWLKLTLKT